MTYTRVASSAPGLEATALQWRYMVFALFLLSAAARLGADAVDSRRLRHHSEFSEGTLQ